MLIIDSLIISGVRFVLDKVAAAVDTELNDDTVLRERLLDAQMRLELGEMTQDELFVANVEHHGIAIALRPGGVALPDDVPFV